MFELRVAGAAIFVGDVSVVAVGDVNHGDGDATPHLHHGDGVEEAFYTTNRVMTVSFHRYGDFFPGTGDMKDLGKGQGMGYAINVPFLNGLDDVSFTETYKTVMEAVR